MTTDETINQLTTAISAWKQAPNETDRAAAMLKIKTLLDSASPEEAEAVTQIKSLVQILKSLSTVI